MEQVTDLLVGALVSIVRDVFVIAQSGPRTVGILCPHQPEPTLLEARFERAPFVDRNDARDDVERDDALGGDGVDLGDLFEHLSRARGASGGFSSRGHGAHAQGQPLPVRGQDFEVGAEIQLVDAL